MNAMIVYGKIVGTYTYHTWSIWAIALGKNLIDTNKNTLPDKTNPSFLMVSPQSRPP